MPDREKNPDGDMPVLVDNWFVLAHGSGGVMPIPFARDVFLLESSVVGTGFVRDIEKKTENVVPGCVLELRREPGKRYDDLAIQVLNEKGERIGFVPRKENPVLARLMDAGKSLYCKVQEVSNRGNWPQIEIDIYMKDL